MVLQRYIEICQTIALGDKNCQLLEALPWPMLGNYGDRCNKPQTHRHLLRQSQLLPGMEYPQRLDHRFNPIGNDRPPPKVRRADARCDGVAWGAAVGVSGEVGRMGFDGTGAGEGRIGIGAGGGPVIEAGEVVGGGPAPDGADFCRQAPWPVRLAWRAARPLRTSSAA